MNQFVTYQIKELIKMTSSFGVKLTISNLVNGRLVGKTYHIHYIWNASLPYVGKCDFSKIDENWNVFYSADIGNAFHRNGFWNWEIRKYFLLN